MNDSEFINCTHSATDENTRVFTVISRIAADMSYVSNSLTGLSTLIVHILFILLCFLQLGQYQWHQREVEQEAQLSQWDALAGGRQDYTYTQTPLHKSCHARSEAILHARVDAAVRKQAVGIALFVHRAFGGGARIELVYKV